MAKTPLDAYQAKLDNKEIRLDPDQQFAVRELQRLYNELLNPPRAGLFRVKQTPKGVYLWGGVGRGKSMVMDMFYDTLPDTIKKRRVHFHEFMIGVHEFLHKARSEKDSDGEAAIIKCAKDIAANTQLLCFDEFHVTDIADAMILGRLFTAVFKNGVVVVATSNWPPERLYEEGLQRELFLPFIDLVKDKLDIVELNGDIDYRLECLTSSGVYFAPLGTAASKKSEELFERLTDNMTPVEEMLTVKGRTIEVHSTAKGVARFSFAQLCERPMGAEDYLAIAKNYHTVFLEGMPKLNYDRRNEAKRLMTLVDALYDQKTKLVVTADAPPDKLYLGHDHAFEFERTVSRLIEMQSDEYLKE